MNWMYVFIGGGLGSMVRYFISQKITFDPHTQTIPYATLLSNILSCFICGIFIASIDKNVVSESYKTLLIVGFCGGFSTFSAFSNESLVLINNQNYLGAFGYIIISIVLGLLALFLGHKLIGWL